MKIPTSVFNRSLLAIVLSMAVGGACIAGPVVSDDSAKWELPTADASDPHRLTVKRLLRYSAGTPTSPPLPSWSEDTTSRIGREQASLYIAGVLDSGEQTHWCVTQSNVPPHEVEQVLLSALAKAADESNAATALRAAAESRFPCQS